MKKVLIMLVLLFISINTVNAGAGGDAWRATKKASGEAWEGTKDGSKKVWKGTKEGSKSTWESVKEFFE